MKSKVRVLIKKIVQMGTTGYCRSCGASVSYGVMYCERCRANM